jgi:hypothetical protein
VKEIAADIRATIWATLASNSCQFLTLKFKKADGLLYLLRLLNLLCLETVVTAAALILNCPHNAWCHTRPLGRLEGPPAPLRAMPSRNASRRKIREGQPGRKLAESARQLTGMATHTGKGDVRS